MKVVRKATPGMRSTSFCSSAFVWAWGGRFMESSVRLLQCCTTHGGTAHAQLASLTAGHNDNIQWGAHLQRDVDVLDNLHSSACNAPVRRWPLGKKDQSGACACHLGVGCYLLDEVVCEIAWIGVENADPAQAVQLAQLVQQLR